jgi:hypothetical protein
LRPLSHGPTLARVEPFDHRTAASNDALPRLDLALIRDGVGARNLDRARLYLAWGALFDLRRQGATLTARCEGSSEERYRVRARLDARGVAEALCSCPVGESGGCKHVGALLVAWLESPARFTVVDALDDTLATLGEGALLTLVRTLLARRPELEGLVESLVPHAPHTAPDETPRDAWGARASELLRAHLDGDGHALADDLTALTRELGDTTAHDDLERARGYESIAAAIVGRWRRLGPDAAAALSVARACLDALADCLARCTNAAMRAAMLDALTRFYRFDIDQGTATHHTLTPGRHAIALAATAATDDERRALSDRVREACEDADPWPRRAWSIALLSFEEGVIDDEVWVSKARELQRFGALTRHLCARDRLDEALDEAKRAHDAEVIDAAAALSSKGLVEEAERLVASRMERASESNRAKMSAWLKTRAEARRDALGVISAMEAELRARPDLAAYDALREKARTHGVWRDVEARVYAWLDERGSPLLLDVLVRDARHDEALRVALGDRLKLTAALSQKRRLAESMERERPRDARAVYRRVVEGLIALRSRPHYREACRVISRALALDARLDGEAEGNAWLATLRERYAALPALQQELDARNGSDAAAA